MVCILLVYLINLNIHVSDAILVTYSWEHLNTPMILFCLHHVKNHCVLSDICKKFSLEFQVNFNSSKSKLIFFLMPMTVILQYYSIIK